MYRLRVIAGPDHGTMFELTPGDYVLGRGTDADLRLADESVSRRHAHLSVTDTGLTLVDLDSHNGSCINGQAVTSGRASEGDELWFGDTRAALERSEGPAKATVSVRLVGPAEEDAQRPDGATASEAPPPKPSLPSDSRRLAILYEVGNTINAAVGLDPLLERVLATLLDVVPAERGALLLWQEDEQRWAPAAVEARPDAPSGSDIAVSRAIIDEAFAAGGPIYSPDATADPRFRPSDSIEALAIRSTICCPLTVRGERLGVLHLDSRQTEAFTDEDVRLVGAIGNQAAIAIANARLNETLRKENVSLRRALDSECQMVGSSAALRDVMRLVRRVSQTDTTVLLRGESGTGKEVAARTIHVLSARRTQPFVCVNCAAMPETLLESELFGHEKGAFTGAVERRIGRFELASGGTVFLDEIGEMAPGTQAKLLRVLQEREFRRVGGTRPIRVDVRVIASTNRDLKEAIAAGEFRQDLYFRIKVVEVVLPPLRERLEDIPELCAHFLGQVAGEMGRPAPEVADETLPLLRRHRWPGNIRELRNVLERAMVLGVGNRLEPKHLPRELRQGRGAAAPVDEDLSLAEMERRHIAQVLDLTDWNKSRAADLLSISRPRLDRKIRDYDLQPPGE